MGGDAALTLVQLLNSIIQNNHANNGTGVFRIMSPNFENVSATDNNAISSGGGIYCGLTSGPVLNHVTISNNSRLMGEDFIYPKFTTCVFKLDSLGDAPEGDYIEPDSITIVYSNIKVGGKDLEILTRTLCFV